MVLADPHPLSSARVSVYESLRRIVTCPLRSTFLQSISGTLSSVSVLRHVDYRVVWHTVWGFVSVLVWLGVVVEV